RGLDTLGGAFAHRGGARRADGVDGAAGGSGDRGAEVGVRRVRDDDADLRPRLDDDATGGRHGLLDLADLARVDVLDVDDVARELAVGRGDGDGRRRGLGQRGRAGGLDAGRAGPDRRRGGGGGGGGGGRGGGLGQRGRAGGLGAGRAGPDRRGEGEGGGRGVPRRGHGGAPRGGGVGAWAPLPTPARACQRVAP